MMDKDEFRRRRWQQAREAGGGYMSTATREPPAKPNWFFFYGTLMNPEQLARVAGLDEKPELLEAAVKNRKLMYWGQFPALCHGEETIYGVMWYAPTAEIVERLRAYETDAYRETFLRMYPKNGEPIIEAMSLDTADTDEESEQPVNDELDLPTEPTAV
jgi:gamma-glutamylcyclotransferase (GGCT)/AIG2-like uncharacterized protein YtfP